MLPEFSLQHRCCPRGVDVALGSASKAGPRADVRRPGRSAGAHDGTPEFHRALQHWPLPFCGAHRRQACMHLTQLPAWPCTPAAPTMLDSVSATRAHPEKDLDVIGFQVGHKLAERYAKDKYVPPPARARARADVPGATMHARGEGAGPRPPLLAPRATWRRRRQRKEPTNGLSLPDSRAAAHSPVRAPAGAPLFLPSRAVFENDLAVITFLCKDFWTEVYGKQVWGPGM